MSIYVSGSIAYDRVMTFPGTFSEYIFPDKIHMLNVCFPIGHMDEKRGGTAGNIAYNLALLGEKSTILTSVGRDFGSYKEFLQKVGLTLEGINQLPEEFTSGAYITTDRLSNQITGFHMAAMGVPCGYKYPNLNPATDIAIIAPANVEDMESHAKFYTEKGVRYIFDPGQQIPILKPEQIIAGIKGSIALVSNDYELELICNITGLTLKQILELTPVVITTLGEQGSRIEYRNGKQSSVGVAQINQLSDPTGAGDSYRAGLIKGLMQNMSFEDSARLASVCASFCVECYGTQEHFYNEETLNHRLQQAYGMKLPFSITPLFTHE
ncbi:carbohydrate kinase family protein [Desulfovibrio sp. OttesenSCG-928-F07]|nr:carbohydrate kinase family protein [Desulfovibrio sp. OttesenSCG-928-F07]